MMHSSPASKPKLNNIGIGITGVARAGKDTFANFVIDALNNHKNELMRNKKFRLFVKKYSFAHKIKSDLNSLVRENLMGTEFGGVAVDFFDEANDIKSRNRPFMVAYGMFMRAVTKGRFWYTKLATEISLENPVVAIVPDFRFCEHEHDEHSFFPEYFNIPVRVHIARLTDYNELFPPANEFEAVNDNKIQRFCDFAFTFNSVGNVGKEQVNKQMAEAAEKVVKYVIKKQTEQDEQRLITTGTIGRG